MQMELEKLDVQIFADGADIDGIKALRKNRLIKGFTTNPTLMKQAGISDYLAFSREVLEIIDGLPISLEVFSDDLDEMKRQAIKLGALGENVYVKIPITNTQRISTAPVIHELCKEGVQQNITAIFTVEQLDYVLPALSKGPKSYVSIFAGRIADTGIDPRPIMGEALEKIRPEPQIELIWASPREVLNIVEANEIGCHVITVTHDLLKKLTNIGKGLEQFSLETVKMFANDAKAAGFKI